MHQPVDDDQHECIASEMIGIGHGQQGHRPMRFRIPDEVRVVRLRPDDVRGLQEPRALSQSEEAARHDEPEVVRMETFGQRADH